MVFADLTPHIASTVLRATGSDYRPEEVHVQKREDRWVVLLPQERLAWFAASAAGLRRLTIERRVLRLLEARCSFVAPRLLFEAPDGGFDVRSRVVGECDPHRTYERLVRDSRLARRMGEEIGHILVEQHTRIMASDVTGWVPHRVPWPEAGDWIRERLPRVVSDPGLLAEIAAAIEDYEALRIDEADHVLVHGDVGLHNLALNPETLAVRGIFDYDGVAWADQHHDFRYLLFDVDRAEMLEGALAVYEPVIGRRLSRFRVALYNAMCASTYLAYRDGVPPEVRWCSRTLVEDLRWTRHAIARLKMMDAAD
jgi:aminoglycoside phosphotransferase (APT) family kinase protein